MSSKPGDSGKTAVVLRQGFINAGCGPYSSIDQIPPESLYFFDDLVHGDILAMIGPDHYFQVNPFEKDTDAREYDSCFVTALESAGLDKDAEYISYMQPILQSLILQGGDYDTLLVTLKLFDKISKSEYKNKPFENDTAQILQRIDLLLGLQSYGLNYFPVVDGGKRRRRYTRQNTIRRRSLKRTTRHLRSRKN
jgi:hypothetical protein